MIIEVMANSPPGIEERNIRGPAGLKPLRFRSESLILTNDEYTLDTDQ